ncbi:Uncharacterised protein [Klebsiella variicola]|nr:Uncharacterised protein [Klebsiella variicola]
MLNLLSFGENGWGTLILSATLTTLLLSLAALARRCRGRRRHCRRKAVPACASALVWRRLVGSIPRYP